VCRVLVLSDATACCPSEMYRLVQVLMPCNSRHKKLMKCNKKSKITLVSSLAVTLLTVIIFYVSDSPSSLITESLSVLSTQSLSSLSSTSSSYTISLDLSKALLMQHFFWHIVVLHCNASPIRRINLMADPLLALKQL
jgi:hypothetical protein